jgi:hypothetical protein
MVHHSIAVVIALFLTNFLELRKGELRRIYLLRTRADIGKKEGRYAPARPDVNAMLTSPVSPASPA